MRTYIDYQTSLLGGELKAPPICYPYHGFARDDAGRPLDIGYGVEWIENDILHAKENIHYLSLVLPLPASDAKTLEIAVCLHVQDLYGSFAKNATADTDNVPLPPARRGAVIIR